VLLVKNRRGRGGEGEMGRIFTNTLLISAVPSIKLFYAVRFNSQEEKRLSNYEFAPFNLR